MAVALFAIALSRYGVSADYVTGRAIALSRDRDYPRVSALLRETSGSSDVYVANDEAALFIVGPAGRRTVAVDRFFSNPYVERETRARDRDEILRALKEGRSDVALGLLAKYGATRVVEIGGGECDALKASRQNLTPVVRLGRVCVFAVRYPPHS